MNVNKARGIMLILKKLKINKISEIQYKYNNWFKRKLVIINLENMVQ